MTTLDPGKAAKIRPEIDGVTVKVADGQVMTAPRVDSINTFDAPETVVPKPYAAKAGGNGLILEAPPKSIMVVRLN